MNLNTLLHGTRERKSLEGRLFTVINNLYPGKGLCLDLGSAAPTLILKESVEKQGYKYTSIDIRKTPGTTQGDIHHIPFKNNIADMLLCIDVIEHITLWQVALQEAYYVLKPGGLFYLHFPIYSVTGETKNILPDQWGHVWHFAVIDVLEVMKKLTFDILRVLLKYDTGDVLIISTKI